MFQKKNFGLRAIENIIINECVDTEIEENTESKELTGYIALWRAVIMQALVDAKGNFTRTEDIIACRKAQSWLLSEKKDFMAVCCMAQYDQAYVLSKAKGIVAKNKRKKSTKYEPRRISFTVTEKVKKKHHG